MKVQKTVDQWDKEDVANWLVHIVKLPEYKSCFLKHTITGDVLFRLTTEDLKELGINKIGVRKKLEAAIELLKKQNMQYLLKKSGLVLENSTSEKQEKKSTEKRKQTSLDDFKQPAPKKQKTKDEKISNSENNPIVLEEVIDLGENKTCNICMDEQESNLFKKLSCKHEFCGDCLKKYYTEKIESRNFPILCPDLKCKKEVQLADLKNVLDSNMIKKFEDYSLQKLTEKESDIFSCCPTPDCGYVFVYMEGDDPHFRCDKCLKHYCLACKCEFHKGKTCIQYQREIRLAGRADELFVRFAMGMKFKQCPGCKRWVERRSGCPHMTCLCGYEFCYLCGKQMELCKCGVNGIQDQNVFQESQ